MRPQEHPPQRVGEQATDIGQCLCLPHRIARAGHPDGGEFAHQIGGALP